MALECGGNSGAVRVKGEVDSGAVRVEELPPSPHAGELLLEVSNSLRRVLKVYLDVLLDVEAGCIDDVEEVRQKLEHCAAKDHLFVDIRTIVDHYKT